MNEKRRKRNQRRQKALVMLMAAIVFLVAAGCLTFIFHGIVAHNAKVKREKQEREEMLRREELKAENRAANIEQSKKIALSYDYEGALTLLKSLEDYQYDEEVMELISGFEAKRDALVPVNMNEIAHIFYHSLIVDPERGFKGKDYLTDGFKQWMTTADEFNKITQAMYDNGYVLIDLHDMVDETTDENGNVHFTVSQLMLPEGKKPFVLSLDDLCYYHSYEGRGMASKIVLDAGGKPICEYIQPNGKKVAGAYDCVPLLDEFIEKHPDASYKGAKGTVALTGYNGILGYRTDISYKTRENLNTDQKKWLDRHPDFDWDRECKEAKKVAEAMKKDGWKFASHTWGHLGVGENTSLEEIKEDNERWKAYVAPLIGETDTIIFAFGEDIADWHDYSDDNEKFSYLKSEGFHYFCNVDATQYFLQIRDDYVRQARINVDGYRLWNDAKGTGNYTDDLFDAAEVLDPKRTDMPEL